VARHLLIYPHIRRYDHLHIARGYRGADHKKLVKFQKPVFKPNNMGHYSQQKQIISGRKHLTIALKNLIDLDEIDGKLKRAHNYWLEKKLDDQLLSRKNIDPLDLIKILPDIELLKILFDENNEIVDFQYDLIGGNINDHAKNKRYGQRLSEIPHQNETTNMFQCFKFAAVQSHPLALKMEYMGPDPRISHAEGIILPLAGDMKHAESLLVAVNFVEKEHDIAGDS